MRSHFLRSGDGLYVRDRQQEDVVGRLAFHDNPAAHTSAITVDGKVEEDTVYLSLNQVVNIITGTAGPTLETQSPIRSGKVEGNRVILEVPVPGGVFKFDLYLEDEHLKGDVIATAQGQTIKAVMDATRVKK